MSASVRWRWSTSNSSTTPPSPSSRTSPRPCACRAGPTRRSSGGSARSRACCGSSPISTARRSPCRAASSSAPPSPAPWSKGADLVLLDEPLANLDYKLREELRDRAAAHLRGVRRHLRLRHHRALGGAAAGRPDDLPVGGPRPAGRRARRRSTAGPTDLRRRAAVLRSAAQHGRRSRRRTARWPTPAAARRRPTGSMPG